MNNWLIFWICFGYAMSSFHYGTYHNVNKLKSNLIAERYQDMIMEDIQLLHASRNLDGNDVWSGAYGPHLLLDMHGCDISTFTHESIEGFMIELCSLIDMDREDFHFWDDEGVLAEEQQIEPHAAGITIGGVFKKKVGIQFIITSSIVIHTLSILKRAYVDIFSCKKFNDGLAKMFAWNWFDANSVGSHLIVRH